MLLFAISLSAILACSTSNEKKSSNNNPPTEGNRTTDEDGNDNSDTQPQNSDGKTNICNYSFDEDKSVDHFSILNRTWRSLNDSLKSEEEIDGEMVGVLGGFSLSNKEYRAIDFIFEKYAKEHYDVRTNDKSSFKFEKIAISKPITDGKFKGYRLIAMSGVSDYFMDMKCITTSYKLEKYGDQEELSMAGWTASTSIGDAEDNSKESFFEGKYARGYIQK